MNRFESIIKEAQSISLHEGERKSIREMLSLHITENPVMDVSSRRLHKSSGTKSPWQLPAFIFNWKTTMPAFIMIALLLTGSVTYAAKDALPGDTLYPVKVSVSENLRSTFSLGIEAKAKTEVARAVTRLEEAETLATRGTLDGQTEAQLKTEFSAHAEQAIAYIEKSDSSDSDNSQSSRLAGDFEGKLRAHQYAIFALTADSSVSESQVAAASGIALASDTEPAPAIAKMSLTNTMANSKGKLTSGFVEAIGSVRSRIESASNTRAEIAATTTFKADANVAPVLESARTQASSTIVEAEKYINKRKRVDAEAKVRATATLEEAKGLMVQAEARASAGAYIEAITIFKRAERTAEQAKSELDSYSKIESNMGQNNVVEASTTSSEKEKTVDTTTSVNAEVKAGSSTTVSVSATTTATANTKTGSTTSASSAGITKTILKP